MASKTIKRILYFFLGLLLLLLLALAWNYQRIQRLLHVNSLFEKDNIIANFLYMEEAFPVHTIAKSAQPNPLPYAEMTLPSSFTYEGGKTMTVEDYLADTRTTGLLILHKDTIRHEAYFRGHSESNTHISWSVAKSFVSALIGIALEDGLFASIEDPVTQYVPELNGSGYEGVSIKDILQMSSGVRFNEDYVDYYSDINRFGRSFALGSSLDDFSKSLVNEREPGTFNHYVSIDTQVLGMLLRRVTGKPLSDYLKEKIWDPLGMEFDAQWIVDNAGMEVALGGLNVALRDYARFGNLYLHRGNFHGQQIVPADWISASITPDAPHLQPGNNPLSSNSYGYGFQWWIPPNADGAYLARGVYNQYIYVHPKLDLVIVKNSANHQYGRPGDESMEQTIAFFREVGEQLGSFEF